MQVIDPYLFLLLEGDVRRLLVQTDSEPLQLALQYISRLFTHSIMRYLEDGLVLQRLEDVEDDEDERACARDGDHLPTTTLAVLGSLDNSYKVR